MFFKDISSRLQTWCTRVIHGIVQRFWNRFTVYNTKTHIQKYVHQLYWVKYWVITVSYLRFILSTVQNIPQNYKHNYLSGVFSSIPCVSWQAPHSLLSARRWVFLQPSQITFPHWSWIRCPEISFSQTLHLCWSLKYK